MSRESAEKHPQVLVVDDEAGMREMVGRILDPHFDVLTARGVAEAEEALLRNENIQVLLCDHAMADGKGFDFCQCLHRRHNPAVRVLMTGHGDMELAVRAVNEQPLYHYLTKPFSAAVLLQVVGDAAEEYQRRAKERAERSVREEAALRPSTPRERLAHRCRLVVGVGGLSMLTVFLVLVAAFMAGLLILLVLYFIKSALGIDLFADRHLTDFL